MQFLTNEMRRKQTIKGEFVIAFSVDRDAYEQFVNKFGKEMSITKPCVVTINEFFCKSTREQQDFLLGLIRNIARVNKWRFEEAKRYVLTEEGIEVTEKGNDGIEHATILEIKGDTAEELEQNVKEMQKTCEKEHVYLKEIKGSSSERRFVLCKGLSLMDSKEIWDVTERTLRLCSDLNIQTMSPEEYKKQVQK